MSRRRRARDRKRRHDAGQPLLRRDRRTAWSPVVPGGINVRTRRLVRRGEQLLELRNSWTLMLLGGGALVLAAVLCTVDDVVFRVMAVALVGVGIACLWPRTTRIDVAARVLHLQHGQIAFDDVGALQIVVERLKSRATDFNSYELNVVLNDGTRFNLMDHGDLKNLKRDAATLREVIGCALWDDSVDAR